MVIYSRRFFISASLAIAATLIFVYLIFKLVMPSTMSRVNAYSFKLDVLPIPGSSLLHILQRENSEYGVVELIALGRNAVLTYPRIDFSESPEARATTSIYPQDMSGASIDLDHEIAGTSVSITGSGIQHGSGGFTVSDVRDSGLVDHAGNMITVQPSLPTGTIVQHPTLPNLGGLSMNHTLSAESSIANAFPVAPHTPELNLPPLNSPPAGTDNPISLEPQEYTATITFPSEYELNHMFIVTLAVVKGKNSGATLMRTMSTTIQGNKIDNQYLKLAPAKQMQAVLWYDYKIQESGDPTIQAISSKYASLWTWQVTPETVGKHFVKIQLNPLLNDYQPNAHQPYIHEIMVTEKLWSKVKRIWTTWITPQSVPPQWLWITIMYPLLLIAWKVFTRWRNERIKKKRFQQREKFRRGSL